MTATDGQLDRCAGVLLGLGAGDALGAGYEFRFPLPRDEEATMTGGGLGGWYPGEWTDDTQMAICIAEEAATGDLDPTAVAERFLTWYRSGPADVGIQTSSVLSSAQDGPEVPVTARRYFEANPKGAAGNGSLMRTAPVALTRLGDDEAVADLARDISSLTHADPLAGDACVLWCIAIDRAIRLGALDGIWDGVDRLPPARQTYWAERLREATEGPPARFSPNGFVVPALQAAISAIWHTPVREDLPCLHLQQALQAAVHVGQDTDTVAAIAGSLLGARWGASAIPVRWRLQLHGKPGVYGQPDYGAQDLVRLAVLAARGGKADSSGWPVTDDLTGYYLERWPMEPLCRRLAEDPGVLLANFAGAKEKSADVVVSLCRMGHTPLGAEHVEVWLLDADDRASNPNLDFILRDLAQAIYRWREEDKTVLVHCVQCERRTPAVAAAYLAERFGTSGEAAWTKVRAQLPTTMANRSFAESLRRLWP